MGATCCINLHLSLLREACKYIQDQLSISTEELGTESILNVAKTSMSSKLVGIDSDFFANMVVDGAMAVKRTGPKGETKCPIKSVNILKAHGGNMKESRLIQGYALNCTVASEGMSLVQGQSLFWNCIMNEEMK